MNKRKKTALARGLSAAALAFISAPMWLTATEGSSAQDPIPVIAPQIPSADRSNSNNVFLEHADVLHKQLNDSFMVLTGNVEFRKGGMMMYCDSAHFYSETESLDAYGNVRMEQGDTLFVYADTLKYRSQTQLGFLWGAPVRMINKDVTLVTDEFVYDFEAEYGFYEVGGTLTDKENRLVSQQGTYVPATKEASFFIDVRLNSINENKDSVYIFTDTLYYNTDTHIAEMFSPSEIINKRDTIFTTYGVYDTNTDIAELYQRSKVRMGRGTTLEGDTLYYDKVAGFGWARGNMEIVDSGRQSSLSGDYGYYDQIIDSAYVTGRALAKEYSRGDTLYLHGREIFSIARYDTTLLESSKSKALAAAAAAEAEAKAAEEAAAAEAAAAEAAAAEAAARDSSVVDTLTAVVDTILVDEAIVEPLPIDSLFAPILPIDSLSTEILPVDTLSTDTVIVEDIAVEPVAPKPVIDKPLKVEPLVSPLDSMVVDTFHIMLAYPRVRFYRSDMQGICDTMRFDERDSTLYMVHNPIVWSEQRQIFGNEINLHMNDSTIDRAILPNFGFSAELIEEGYFNQLSGKEMVAYFDGNDMRRLDVNGNVEAIMFPMENDSTYNKVISMQSSYLTADFEKRQLIRMKTWPETTGKVTPLYLAKRSIFFLPKFKWYTGIRPISPEDVFIIPPEMEILMGGVPEEEPAEEPELPAAIEPANALEPENLEAPAATEEPEQPQEPEQTEEPVATETPTTEPEEPENN